MLDQFQALTSLDSPIYDGKIHRFGKKDHGWYVATSWDYKGENYKSIKVGSWNGSIQETVLKSWNPRAETTEFRKKHQDHSRETEAKLKAEKFEKHKICKEKWGPIFDKADKEMIHPYAEYKKIKNYCSRVDMSHTLLIPAYNINGFVGVQRIFQDPETKQFVKRFSSGIQVSGAICNLSPFSNAKMAYLSEGFATAASIQEAFPEIPSICAFAANNLSSAIHTIRQVNPSIRIVIAADKDISKTGERYAKRCCSEFREVIYKLPATDNQDWTDFNDIHNFISLKEVKNQLTVDSSDFDSVTCLGYNDEYFFYTSTTNKQVVPIKAHNHGKNSFLSLAEIDFWRKKYSTVDEETGKSTIPWDKITSDLMAECKQLGIFHPDKVRGSGVWSEGGKMVINDGERVISDKKDLSYYYQVGRSSGHQLTEDLSPQDRHSLLAAIKKLKYKNEDDYLYIAAFIVQAQIFSVLPWRFHLWITGEAGCGKSYLLKWIKSMTTNALMTNNATAAGLVQELGCDARATIYDESEVCNDRMKDVMELARQMNSPGDFKTLRGSSAGKSIKNNTNTIFCMGSIQTGTESAADRSRFITVEMMRTTGQTKEEFDQISEILTEAGNFKDRLFTYCYNHAGVILKNIKTIRNALKDAKVESRQADQMSSALACFFIMESPEVISEEVAQLIIERLNLSELEYMKQTQETDQGDCLTEILEIILVPNEGTTVAFCIDTVRYSSQRYEIEKHEKLLSSVGLKFEKLDSSLYVSKNLSLKTKLKNYPDYMKVLRRHEDFEAESNIRIGGIQKKCLKVRIE